MHKHLQEYGIYQRISQSMDRANSPINSLLEQAACIVRRSKATAGTLEPTESYKRRPSPRLRTKKLPHLHSLPSHPLNLLTIIYKTVKGPLRSSFHHFTDPAIPPPTEANGAISLNYRSSVLRHIENRLEVLEKLARGHKRIRLSTLCGEILPH